MMQNHTSHYSKIDCIKSIIFHVIINECTALADCVFLPYPRKQTSSDHLTCTATKQAVPLYFNHLFKHIICEENAETT